MKETDGIEFLRYALTEKELADTYELFTKEGLNPILVKGWAAAQYYPQPFQRHLGDFDLAFSVGDFEKARILKRNLGLHKVDLHLEFRHLDKSDWELLYKNSILKKCGNTEIRILCPEDHLRVLCVHWLTDGGVAKDKLLDILYLIRNRGEQLSWKKVFEGVSERRVIWIQAVIKIAFEEFDNSRQTLPFCQIKNDLPEWFKRTLQKEWNRPERLTPMHHNLKEPKLFVRQVLKRFPPNPIQAMVHMEGDLFKGNRIFYQLGSLLRRVVPSLRRLLGIRGNE